MSDLLYTVMLAIGVVGLASVSTAMLIIGCWIAYEKLWESRRNRKIEDYYETLAERAESQGLVSRAGMYYDDIDEAVDK